MQRFVISRKLGGLFLALSVLVARGEQAAESPFRNHGLPPGSRLEVLPQGAILHVQLGSLYQSLTNVELLVKSLVPAKAVPPPLQELVQSDHPLLTFLGMQTIQAPLTPEAVVQGFGLDPTRAVTATLYVGDPRKSVILTLPLADPKAFGGAIQSMLQPNEVEEETVAEKPAVRVSLNAPWGPLDLYVVCSATEAYVCADRSLAVTLHSTPTTQRLNSDAFIKQVADKLTGQDLALVFNPGLAKPFLVQAQQLSSLVVPILQMQRAQLLGQMNPQVKSRVEMQLRRDLGVKDLNEFADYAECVISATLQSGSEALVKNLIAFEGVCLTAKLDPIYPQVSSWVYSQEIQPEKAAQPVPMAEVRQAMAWLGNDLNSFTVVGRQPQVKPSAFATAWFAAMKTAMTGKGLKTAGLEKFQDLVLNQPIHQPIASQVPWMLTTSAPLSPAPSIGDYQSLEKYGEALANQLSLPTHRPVYLVPGQNTAFLEAALKDETLVLNSQERRGREFWEGVSGKKGWLDHENRFQASELEGGIKRYVQESAFTTQGGIFGYDQHELINRRIYAARTVNGYLVYHQGARNVSWLAKLGRREAAPLAPGLVRLLDRVPEGANYFHVQRVLSELPGAVEWIGALESLAHADIRAYLEAGEKIQKETKSKEEADKALAELKMPPLVYSLNRESSSGKLYCLLPGGIVFPRNKVTTILTDVLSEFSAKAKDLGGCVSFSRVQPGVRQCQAAQNTEALALLISSVGNQVVDRYLATPEKQQTLMQTLMAEGDRNPERFDEILVKNPTWEFIPSPQPHREVKTAKGIPKRDQGTPAQLLSLSKFYNANLKESWHAGGLAGNTLANLPTGLQEFAGVKWDIRGLVQLSGKSALEQLEVRFPKEVKGIKVNQKAGQVHFLHATGWSAPEGATIGSYLLHYANGETREIPIVYGRDVRDWWTQENEPASDTLTVAWTGPCTVPDNNTTVRLFKTSWKNPLPDVDIKTIDYRTAMTTSAPFLVAITVE